MRIKRCMWWRTSREQREHEIQRGLDKTSTNGFEDMGCFDNCQGYNTVCKSYQPDIYRTSRMEITQLRRIE